MTHVGKYLEDLRVNRRMSQRELAIAAHMDPQTIYRIESSAKATLRRTNAVAIFTALDERGSLGAAEVERFCGLTKMPNPGSERTHAALGSAGHSVAQAVARLPRDEQVAYTRAMNLIEEAGPIAATMLIDAVRMVASSIAARAVRVESTSAAERVVRVVREHAPKDGIIVTEIAGYQHAQAAPAKLSPRRRAE